MKAQSARFRYALIVVLAILLFFTIFPLYFMLVSSLKTNFELQTNFFGFPGDPQFEYYSEAFAKVKTYLLNSTYISGTAAIGAVFVSCLSAYVYARFRFPFKNLLFGINLAFLMIPGVLMLVPQFVLVTKLGLMNSPWAAILPYIASGQLVITFVLRTFFEEIPKELFESMRIDGSGEVRMFFQLCVPFALPIILSMALLNILNSWNDFIWPLLVLPDQKHMTLTVGLFRFMDQQQILYGKMFAGMTLGTIPLMILFGFTMKYFVQGMTSGAIKA
ncbi:carbohydrate ABC transporter permease [Cohnella sp. REN36]|uniref:carbohydrate ABC transporter permease n=1 Tax=Cohnella sp. REN36 TaxID=2887347 RepID=UPI001D144668|nr:carbohydrate ABC transporter permease [Cohnella sp. REN36]MCC3375844.1 carbohydrate ABC transporter permease [Cohnella sp. REN36]